MMPLRRSRSLLVVGLFAACVGRSGAVDDGLGKSAASYLGIGMGGRAAAMGGAAATGPGDAASIYWNPALLANVRGPEFSVGSLRLSSDRTYQFGALAVPFKKGGGDEDFFGGSFGEEVSDRKIFRRLEEGRRFAVAVGYVGMGVDGIDGADEFGNAAAGFTDQERAILAAFSAQIFEDFSAGLGVDYLTQTLGDAEATGLGFSFGVEWVSPSGRWRWGAAGRSLGASLDWEVPDALTGDKLKYSESVASRLSGGFSWHSAGDRWIVAAEARSVTDQKTKPHAGVEWRPVRRFALRGGLNGDAPTLGAGVGVPLGKRMSMGLDYSYQQDPEDFDSPHWLTASLRF